MNDIFILYVLVFIWACSDKLREHFQGWWNDQQYWLYLQIVKRAFPMDKVDPNPFWYWVYKYLYFRPDYDGWRWILKLNPARSGYHLMKHIPTFIAIYYIAKYYGLETSIGFIGVWWAGQIMSKGLITGDPKDAI